MRHFNNSDRPSVVNRNTWRVGLGPPLLVCQSQYCTEDVTDILNQFNKEMEKIIISHKNHQPHEDGRTAEFSIKYRSDKRLFKPNYNITNFYKCITYIHLKYRAVIAQSV
jgi:hypothetical protein